MRLPILKMSLAVLTLIIGITYGEHHLSAGGHAGNGGDGVIIDEIPYLLDLVEAGVHVDPYFANRNDFYPKLRDRIMTHMGVEEPVANLIAAKIKEMDTAAPFFGYLIKLSLFSLYWTFLDQELMDVDDHGDTVMEYRKLELVQVAVRKGFDVTINKTIWKKMIETNRAASIIHEAVYAISPHHETKVIIAGSTVKTIQQFGSGARAIVGWIFRENFAKQLNTNRLLTFLHDHRYFNVPYEINFSRILNENNRMFFRVTELWRRWKHRGYEYLDILRQELILPHQTAEDLVTLAKFPAPFLTENCVFFDSKKTIEEISTPYSFEWLP